MSVNPLPFDHRRPAPPRRRPTPPPRSEPRVGGVVTLRDGSLHIKFSAKHPPYIRAVKQIHGAHYSTETFTWVVGLGNLRHVRRLADEHGWVVSAGVKNMPDIDVHDSPINVTAQGEQLVLHGSYSDEVWELLGDSDARYERKTGRWFIPAESCFDVILDLQRMCDLRFVGDQNDILRRIEEAQEMIRLSRQLEPSRGWELTRPIGRELRPFQHCGVEYLVRSRRGFGWATMGAGKTTVALVALNELNAFPALVVAPAGIKTNWEREVHAVLPGRTVHICESMNASQPLTDPDVWVANYDILGKHTEAGSWSHQFVRTPLAALVIDEGHRVKNPNAIRTQSMIAVSNAMPADAPRFLLTGTPVRNKRVEVHPQLAIIGRDGEFGNKKQLNADDRLSRRLRSVCAWRPDPKEVLRSLGHDGENPDPNIVVVDGDPKVMVEYREAERNLIDYIRRKAEEKAIELGLDPHAEGVRAALKASAAQHLMAVNVLSRIASRAKIHAAREWVSDFLTSDDKLLVFAENRDVMAAIAGETIPQIHGDVGHADRMALCDRFQGGDLQAIVLQIVAAGEGLTLTEAWHTLFAQIDWVPGAHDQALARAAWRMNDPHPVQAHYLVCADTIDEVRMAVLETKRQEMRFVTDGDREQITQSSTFGDVFERLLRRAIDHEPTTD